MIGVGRRPLRHDRLPGRGTRPAATTDGGRDLLRGVAAAPARPWIGLALGGTAALAGYALLAADAGLSAPAALPFGLVGAIDVTVAAGVAALRPHVRTWRLLALAAAVWFAQALVLSDDPTLAWIGLEAQHRDLVVAFHMALAVPLGRLPSVAARATVGAAYAVAVVVGVIDAITRYACGGPSVICDGPVSFGDLSPGELVATIVGRVLVVGVVACGVVVVVRRLRAGDRAIRRAAAPLLAAVVVNGAILAATDLDVLPGGALGRWVRIGSVALIPLGVAAGLALVELHRAQLTGLLLALDRGLTPGELRDRLAHSLGDDSLVVCFPTEGGLVDHGGRPAVPGGPGRVVTPVAHDGAVVALLDHVEALTAEPDLLAATTAASRLALENARLTALVQAQVLELRESRRRLVETGDRERRQVERDLHDGAQQQLLTVGLELGRLRHRAHRAGDDELANDLGAIGQHLDAAVDELRRLARGLHPTVLSDRGLGPAVEALAQRAAIAIDVDVAVPRLAPPVETTAYFVVVEAVANAIRHSGATTVAVAGRVEQGRLEVTIRDDGTGGAVARPGGGLRGLDDRAVALGGTLVVRSTTGAGTMLVLRLPVGAS